MLQSKRLCAENLTKGLFDKEEFDIMRAEKGKYWISKNGVFEKEGKNLKVLKENEVLAAKQAYWERHKDTIIENAIEAEKAKIIESLRKKTLEQLRAFDMAYYDRYITYLFPSLRAKEEFAVSAILTSLKKQYSSEKGRNIFEESPTIIASHQRIFEMLQNEEWGNLNAIFNAGLIASMEKSNAALVEFFHVDKIAALIKAVNDDPIFLMAKIEVYKKL